jgi:hypothetical protein
LRRNIWYGDALLTRSTAEFDDRVIKGIFVLISAFIAIALIVLPALILVPEGAGLIGTYKHVNREAVISLTEVSLAEGVAIAVLLLLILRKLRRIVDSAIISDPLSRRMLYFSGRSDGWFWRSTLRR